MTFWHGYFGIEAVSMSTVAKQALITDLRKLGRKKGKAVHILRERISLDLNKVLFEALFDTDNLTIAKFKQRLGVIYGVSPESIEHATDWASWHPRGRSLQVLFRRGSARLRFVMFGGPESVHRNSRDQCYGYLQSHIEEWEADEV